VSEEELVAAFKAGRLTRRAFVRQLVERGMPFNEALEFAEQLVPEAGHLEPAATAAQTGRRGMSSRPVQAGGLEVKEVSGGYMILDAARDRGHSLNHTAVVVFELCTGQNDSTKIAQLLQSAFGLPSPPLAETLSCLERLFHEGLID
jgi:hypothetical protein